MSFGGADNPFNAVELTPKGGDAPEQPPRLLEEIAADHDAGRAAVQAEHGEAMRQEERYRQIGEAVFALATDGAEGEKYLGRYIEHETFPDGTNRCLYQAECRRRQRQPDYDITTEEPRRIARYLALGLARSNRFTTEEKTETDKTTATVRGKATIERRKDGADRRAAWMAQFNGDFVAMVEAADTFPTDGDPLLAAEQARLKQFQQVLSVAAAVPADAAIIRERVRMVDFSAGVPDPVQFARVAIFDRPGTPSGVSVATQTAVAEALGVTLNQHQPRTASELQYALAEGRGTEMITEIRTVEEPPGSGIYVEKEVVVEERGLDYNEADRLVLSTNPLVTLYPDPPGGTRYRITGQIVGAAPVCIWREIPRTGSFPAEAINNAMNELLIDVVFRNHGLAGGLQALFGTGDSSLGTADTTDMAAVGHDSLTQGLIRMFCGENTTLGGRFLTEAELYAIGQDARWFAPDGDFGGFNRMDPQAAGSLLGALFGTGNAEIVANMNRAQLFMNTGGAEAPSFEALYRQMYPEDAAEGYQRLRALISDETMAALSFYGRN